MLHLLAIACFFYTVSASNDTMIVVWGLPTSFTGAVVNSTLDKDQCIEACLETRRCVLAHIMLQTTTCRLFMYNATTSVTRTTAANESVVAFKVIGIDECPVGENPPTFDNKTANGYILLDDDARYLPAKVYYNISFVDNVWSFSNKTVSSCTSPWAGYILHSDGTDICVILIQVYKQSAANTVYPVLNQTFSVESCTSLSATLPGINYSNDHDYFEAYVKNASDKFPSTSLHVRIDGKRTTECQADPTTATCMSPEGFTFTDENFKNFDNYNWVTNSSARAGSDDDCLVYVVNGSATIKVDVGSCTANDTLQPYGHICVKPAYQE